MSSEVSEVVALPNSHTDRYTNQFVCELMSISLKLHISRGDYRECPVLDCKEPNDLSYSQAWHPEDAPAQVEAAVLICQD